jgi:hypothetical protein
MSTTASWRQAPPPGPGRAETDAAKTGMVRPPDSCCVLDEIGAFVMRRAQWGSKLERRLGSESTAACSLGQLPQAGVASNGRRPCRHSSGRPTCQARPTRSGTARHTRPLRTCIGRQRWAASSRSTAQVQRSRRPTHGALGTAHRDSRRRRAKTRAVRQPVVVAGAEPRSSNPGFGALSDWRSRDLLSARAAARRRRDVSLPLDDWPGECESRANRC